MNGRPVATASINILRRSSIARKRMSNSLASRCTAQMNNVIHHRTYSDIIHKAYSIRVMGLGLGTTQHEFVRTKYICRPFSNEVTLDPSTLQFEFNQLMNNLSLRAFDLSYQELQQSFHELEEKMRGMEEQCIPIQNDENYLQTVQKLMSRCASLGTINGAELTEKYLTLVLNSSLKGRIQFHAESRGSNENNSSGSSSSSSSSNYDDAPDIMPTRQMFTLAMDAWAKLDLKRFQDNHRNALMPAQRAQQILDFMWEEYYNNPNGAVLKPDVIHYTTVLQALANASSKRATQMAQNLLKQAEKRSGLQNFLIEKNSLSGLDPNLVPDRACYNTVLYCLAKYFQSRDDIHGRLHSAQFIMGLMEEMMNKMELMADKLNDDAWMPNTRTYNLLLMACSRRPNGGGREAEKILEEMLLKAENLVDHDIGAVILDGYQSSEDLEENSVLPNIKSYNNVINAWSHDRSDEGPERAEEILKALLRKVPPSANSGDITSHPLLNAIYPDVVTFNLAINTWTRSGRAEAGERAERILNLLLNHNSTKAFVLSNELKITLDELNVVPDVISFNSTINAWSKSGVRDGAQRAEGVLTRLLAEYEKHGEVMPNSISFSTSMQAWAKSNEPNRGSKAQDVFDKLISIYRETNDEGLQPSESCYGALISAYCAEAEEIGKREAFEKAVEALSRMQREGGFIAKTSHYNLIISVPSKIRDCDEVIRYDIALKARSILVEMIEVTKGSPHSAPDVYSFNNVLKAFQGYKDEKRKRESLFAVLDIFNMLCESGNCGPNDQTYIHLLKAVQESLIDESEDRALLSEEIFRKCCESGLLTNAVLNIVGNLLPSVSLKRLQACRTASHTGPLTVYNLPTEWSENRRVGQNQRRNRKGRH